MDFRNICSKIDMDAIRAKIPPLPDVLTQLKLPKSIAKLKTRSKIFRSSQEDVAGDNKRSAASGDVSRSFTQQTLSIPPADFVDHTPQKISTISSLVDQQGRRIRSAETSIKRKNPQNDEENYYRNAGGIDDYCPSPLHDNRRLSVPPQGEGLNTDDNSKLSFMERMQKGYKDATEFKLKNMFVKKTVVRQDDIVVKNYIELYSEDLKRQEQYEDNIDRAIKDNYEFEFKLSRGKSEESFGHPTPTDSPANPTKSNTNKKLLNDHSSDESGMELTPPARSPGIAATRFARVRQVPLRMSLDEDEDIEQKPPRADDESDEFEIEEEIPLRNTQPSVMHQKSSEEKPKPSPSRTKSFKKRLSSLGRSEDSLSSPKKRKAPLNPQESEELDIMDSSPPARRPTNSPPEAKPEKSSLSLKDNFKRFQKSFKLSSSSLAAQSGAESEVEESGNNKTKQTKTQQFAERLKRFRSVDNVDRQTEDEQEKEEKTQDSPMHKFTSKIQDWKKSIKRKPFTQKTEDEDIEAESPQKRDKPVGTLIKKLKHIRSRKNTSIDDPDDDEEGGATYRESFRSRAKLQLEKGVAAATQVPQMTMEKIKETKKFFRKTQDKDKDKDKDNDNEKEKEKDKAKQTKMELAKNDSDESDLESETESPRKQQKSQIKTSDSSRPAPTRHYYSSDDEDEEDAYDRQQQGLCSVTPNEPHQQKVMVPLARASWTNKPIHSDSLDTADDDDDDDADILPRVLIHQNNSDVFESTIIIAVTRPISRTHSPSAYIEELPPDSPKVSTPETKADNWIPNSEIISGFREASAPIPRDTSKDTITSNSSSKGHSRKHSMDSSSEDSWIKDIPRGISTVMGLNCLAETDEPWKIQSSSTKKDENLYKTKSIDIFEKSGGGAMKIFDDFDDELKYTPIVKIEDQVETKEKINQDKCVDQDSGAEEEIEDQDPDDDNSSRVTKILKPAEVVAEVKAEKISTPPIKPREDIKLKALLYGNSTESLMGHMDNRNKSDDDNSSEEASDGNEEDDEDDRDEIANRPPSAAPSPPPCVSPPPPPLPERKPSLALTQIPKINLPSTPIPPKDISPSSPTKASLPPPLPQTKPPSIVPTTTRPLVPTVPKVPERPPPLTKVAKPLVKTSSLRLAYDEQVNPQDVGKVNKLISRFEPNTAGGGGSRGFKERPRIIPRIPYMSSQSSEDYSEDDEEEDDDSEDSDMSYKQHQTENKAIENKQQLEPLIREKSLDKTPTNKPNLQKSLSIDFENIPLTPTNNNPVPRKEDVQKNARKSIKPHKPPAPTIVLPPAPAPPREEAPSPPIIAISNLSLQTDQNSNFSQPSSEYGSPMAFPSLRTGDLSEVTPLNSPKDMVFLNTRRSRRSMTRDDERYFSFDSDEENSYYSIGSTNSNRYIVDL